MNQPVSKDDIWYHGNAAALKGRFFLTRSHRDKVYAEDNLCVYREEDGNRVLVAKFQKREDAALVTDLHNHMIQQAKAIEFATSFYGFDPDVDPKVDCS